MPEVGLTPMQIIVGSTKYAAELVQKQDSLGTVEAGKIADILIVSADPLQDIENLKKTDTVIFDGKVIDRSYHANYHDDVQSSRRPEQPCRGSDCRGWSP